MEIDGLSFNWGAGAFSPHGQWRSTIDPEIDAANNPHNGHKKRPEENEPHHQFTRVKVRYA